MNIKTLFYKQNKLQLTMEDGAVKTAGPNLVDMVKFLFQENNKELKNNWKQDHNEFLKEYHNKIQQRLKEGRVWHIVKKIRTYNPENEFF